MSSRRLHSAGKKIGITRNRRRFRHRGAVAADDAGCEAAQPAGDPAALPRKIRALQPRRRRPVSPQEFDDRSHPHTDPTTIFRLRDANGDGFLTQGEFCSGQAKRPDAPPGHLQSAVGG
jgi:hypothetical protein